MGRKPEIKPSNVDNRIFIDLPPICPKCETPLEMKQSFLGYYKWFCPNNDFAKRTRFTFRKRAESAQNIIRTEIKRRLRE